MRKAIREWIKKAEDDFQAAVILAGGKQRFYDQVCFHCQQSAEKFLKALLEAADLAVPKIHDCEALLVRLPLQYASLNRFARGLSFLSEFAVATRYPGENATKRRATSAIRWADKVRSACREHLGLS